MPAPARPPSTSRVRASSVLRLLYRSCVACGWTMVYLQLTHIIHANALQVIAPFIAAVLIAFLACILSTWVPVEEQECPHCKAERELLELIEQLEQRLGQLESGP